MNKDSLNSLQNGIFQKLDIKPPFDQESVLSTHSTFNGWYTFIFAMDEEPVRNESARQLKIDIYLTIVANFIILDFLKKWCWRAWDAVGRFFGFGCSK